MTLSQKLTTIGTGAFYYCPKLKEISLPSTLKKIGRSAFAFSGLTSITIPKNVTSIGIAALACADLTAIKVSSSNTKYSTKGGVLYNKDKTKLIAYPGGRSGTSFTVPSTVKTIAGGAFTATANLASVKLNNVTKIGNYAFQLSSLKSITISAKVNSIGTGAFTYCIRLSKITVSGSNTKYSSKDGVLYNKAQTKLIQYPNGKSGSSFTIPSTVKNIGTSAFQGNSKLKSVKIGAKVTQIGDSAFHACEKLTSINIPNSVKKIGAMAFMDCDKLKTVTIGTGVTQVGSQAFYSCESLKTVKFKGTAPEFSPENPDYQLIFSNSTGTITVKYPSSEKSSWTKSLRNTLKEWTSNYGGSLKFQAY